MALLDTLGSLAGGWMSNSSNKKLARQEYKQNLKMWAAENEYNLPKNQMARYRDAGLNPMLIYGNGTSSSGNTTVSSPQYHAPRMENIASGIQLPSLLNVMDSVQRFRLSQKELELKDEQIDKTKNDSELSFAKGLTEDVKRIYLGIMAGQGKTDSRVKAEIADSQIALFKQKLLDAYQDYTIEGGLYPENLKSKRLDNQLKSELLPHQVENVELRNLLMQLHAALFPEESRNLKVRNDLLETQGDVKKPLSKFGMTGSESGWWKLYARLIQTLTSE